MFARARLVLAALLGFAVVFSAAPGASAKWVRFDPHRQHDRAAVRTAPRQVLRAEAQAKPLPLGAYRGAAAPARTAEFQAWLGQPVSWALDYLDGSSWSTIEKPDWWLNAWRSSPYNVVYSVPLLPSSGAPLQQGAAGAYDGHFVTLARRLVAGGNGDAVLRLGWEFNGGWYTWSAKQAPQAFAAYWRHVVGAMRSVPGARFKFDWCPTLGTGAVAPTAAYPGDAFVDYIGTDVYDQGWGTGWNDAKLRWRTILAQPYGLQWQRKFAADHKKRLTFPEWGLSARSDGHGGGDNPYFIQQMLDWIRTNDVAYALYFDYDAPDGRHSISSGQFPRAAAMFKAQIQALARNS
jgi:hypothetical protein